MSIKKTLSELAMFVCAKLRGKILEKIYCAKNRHNWVIFVDDPSLLIQNFH